MNTGPPRTRVALLGLGRLGYAIGDCLSARGVPLAVWNRTPGRAGGLASRVALAASAADACTDAELVLLALSNHGAGLEVLDAIAAELPLADRTLVQFSAGSASDARTLHAWAQMHGLGYLDAAIVGNPPALGGENAILLCTGEEALWTRHQGILRLLAGNCRYLGESIGAAAAMNCAVRGYSYGATLAMLQGAALAAAESLPLTEYFFLVKKLAPALAATADEAREMIARGIYAGNTCRLDVHVAMLRHIQRMSHDHDIDTRLPDTLVHACRKAIANGHGDDEIAALFETLRRTDHR